MTDQQGLYATDFGRSFLSFSSTRVNHTPRLQLDAACALNFSNGSSKQFFLSSTCIGEAMYVPDHLIHEPVCEFNVIAAPRDQFLIVKRHANAQKDVRSPHRYGEVMPTHDGKGAKVVALDVHLSNHQSVRPIRSYGEFREASLGYVFMNARTTYTDEDGTKVVMDYPVKTTNVANDKEAWQVDAGPVLMPLNAEKSELPVSRMGIGFIVFNGWNYAEAVIRDTTGLGPNQGATNFYSVRRKLECVNELFAVK